MSAPVVDVASRSGGRRPSAGVWIAAAAEIAVAVGVGLILFRSGHPAAPEAHSMPGMADMPAHHHAPQIHWTAESITAVIVTSALFLWWAFTRNRLAALLTAGGLIGVAALAPVRTLALQSHLVAMAALEAVLVAAPLLLMAALGPNRTRPRQGHSVVWATGVVIAVAVNGALLIVLHLPGVHGQAAALEAVPLWIPGVAVIVGCCYWAAVLLTEGRVAPALRHGALIVGQEVAMILGLAALFLPSPTMQHANPLGISSATDQRLGGLLMILTCAAVALPLTKRLKQRPVIPTRETENHVH